MVSAAAVLALLAGDLLSSQQIGRSALVLGGTLGDGTEQLGLGLGSAGTGGDLLGGAVAASLA